MRKTLLTIFAAVLPLAATSKEKIDPVDYTLTVVVGTATTESVPTGRKHDLTGNPKCEKGYMTTPACEDMKVPYTETYVKFEVTIEDSVYTLRGKTTLSPGTYKARFIFVRRQGEAGGLRYASDYPRAVEFLVTDKKGHSKAVQYNILSKSTVSKKTPIP